MLLNTINYAFKYNNISLDDLFNEYVEKARNMYKTNHPKLGEKHLLIAEYIKNQKD